MKPNKKWFNLVEVHFLGIVCMWYSLKNFLGKNRSSYSDSSFACSFTRTVKIPQKKVSVINCASFINIWNFCYWAWGWSIGLFLYNPQANIQKA
jgi:hypothetical protein